MFIRPSKFQQVVLTKENGHEFMGIVNFEDQSFLEKLFWDSQTKKFKGDIRSHLMDLKNMIEAELTKFEWATKHAVRFLFLSLALFVFCLIFFT